MTRDELDAALLAGIGRKDALGFVREFDEPGWRGWVTLERAVPDPPNLFPPRLLRKMTEYVVYQDKIRARPYTVRVWEAVDTDDPVREMASVRSEERNFANLDDVEEYLTERCGKTLAAVGPLLPTGRAPDPQ
jgi:hypothetical protein